MLSNHHVTRTSTNFISGLVNCQHNVCYIKEYWGDHQCCLGCDSVETIHHLFVICPKFGEYCITTTLEIQCVTAGLVESIPSFSHERILQVTSSILKDLSPLSWPFGFNSWYYGHSPDLSVDFPFLSSHLMVNPGMQVSFIWSVEFGDMFKEPLIPHIVDCVFSCLLFR